MAEARKIRIGNLYQNIPDDLAVELFTDIAAGRGARIERIVSSGHATPGGEWYDQERDEWVLVLRGKARLAFGDGHTIELNPGDHVLIPAHCRHRVERTSQREPTVWLAVHYDGVDAAP